MSTLTATNGKVTTGTATNGTATNGTATNGTAPWPIVMLRVDQIDASPYQPRLIFDPQELEELAQSVRAQGVQQPILVRTIPADPDESNGKAGRKAPVRYELIAGERRLRACRMAERRTLPAIVRDDLSDAQAAELCLLENVQRAGLSAIEEARGYKRLMLDFRLKEERLAKKVGKSVPVLREMMKLLLLPMGVQELLIQRRLTPAHGHELLRLSNHSEVCQAVASYAVLHGVTAAALGRDILPNAREMEKRSQVISLDHRTKFDRTLCRECPHKAYFTTPGHGSYCLRPDEWKRKQLEAEMRRSDEASRVLEEARHKADEAHRAAAAVASFQSNAGGLEVTDELGEKKCAETTCQLPRLSDLPLLSDLSRGNYRDLRWGEVPPNCTPACPCRGLARADRSGNARGGDSDDQDEAHVAICLDPRRFQEQVRAERERKEEEKRKHFRALSDQAIARLTSQWEEGQRQPILALLLLPFLDGHGVRRGYLDAGQWEAMWRDMGERLGIELPWDDLFDDETQETDQLRLLSRTRHESDGGDQTDRSHETEGEAPGALALMLLVAALLVSLEAQEAARWGGETPLIEFILEPEARAQMALSIGAGDEGAEEERPVSPVYRWSDPDFAEEDAALNGSENSFFDDCDAECADGMEVDFPQAETSTVDSSKAETSTDEASTTEVSQLASAS